VSKRLLSKSGIAGARFALGTVFSVAGVCLAALPFASSPTRGMTGANTASQSSPVRKNRARTRNTYGTASTDPASGGWSIVPSPNTSATESNYLFGIACTSPTQCWAVGRSYDGSVYHTLILQWDGSSWSIVSSPNTSPTQSNYLSDIACSSGSQCWAVGRSYDGSNYHTLTLQWDGNSWAIVASPDASATASNYLFDVTCNSASDCWAVGYYIGTDFQTLIEHWDGVSWSIVPSPNTSTTDSNFLTAVTCSSASDCWAVGEYSRGAQHTLTMQWNGVAWSIVPSPNHDSNHGNFLGDVTCTSASDCWAVGGYYANGPETITDHTLVERWDGASWSIVNSPTVGTGDNELNNVTCLSASQCWAVGDYKIDASSVTPSTLIEQWNGQSWSVASSPNTSENQDNRLYAVTCSSAFQCWTVGQYYNENFTITQTLIELYTPPLEINSIKFANGHALIKGVGLPSSPINIQTSPDLIAPFDTIDTVMSGANGAFQYQDNAAGSEKFYRAAYPED
jgi:hypothetical protein